MSKRTRLILIGIVVVALAVAACIFIFTQQPKGGGQHTSLDLSALDTLPTRNESTVDLTHLDPKLTPPTNSWMSGMVLQQTPKAVFPLPLSFKPAEDGYAIGLPTVTTNARLITAPFTPAVTTTLEQADNFKLTRYDRTSATLTYANKDSVLADITLAEGSPYIFTTARSDTKLTVKNVTINQHDDTSARITAAGGQYGLVTSGGGRVETNGNNITVRLSRGATLTTYAIPKGQTDELKKYAGNVVASVDYAYQTTGNASRTILTYHTANNQPTVIGSLPHQQHAGSKTLDASYATLYGQMPLHVGNELSYDAMRITASNQLDLSNLSSDQKTQLKQQLQKDTSGLTLNKEDTYFGGKELYRAANLLDIAHQLDDTETAQTLQAKLSGALNTWFASNEDLTRTKRYFYYDPTLKSVVGETAAFGSEDANDHHFHYAYFIYASSVLARYDSEFLQQHRAQVDLLVGDIALDTTRDDLSQMRYFDPYMGHSWAGGLSPFDDGNNQESSSEAINAWAAMSSWADVSNNDGLKTQAEWQLSHEMNSAEHYWTGFDQKSAPYVGYNDPVIALNWGGKREFNTFFSAEPNAMLGIQLIPMNPTMQKLPTSRDRITTNINSTIKNDNYAVQFGDYILMYQSLTDRNISLERARTLPDTNIDDGNTRTYMYAWIMSQK